MSPVTRSLTLGALLLVASVVVKAQEPNPTNKFPPVPLASKHFDYPNGIPFKVDTDKGLIRGEQYGYNICNSTTEGPESKCQTAFVNSIDDFCVWGPPEPGKTVGDTEGESVAYCSKPGRGTRIFPAGTLKGVQFMRTPDYVQVVGFLDQTQINMSDGDFGGEMDPHGADLRGNPMGGIVFSNAWSGNNNSFTQVIEWHNFMGSNRFCFKVCDPSKPNAAQFCEHRLDRIGCLYNAPNNAQEGEYTSCEGDNQDFPGVYTENGQVKTYTQPPESLGAISTMPYQPKVPASSNCVTYQSSALFAALATVSPLPGGSSTSSGSSSRPTGTSSGSRPSSGTGTNTATATGATQSGNSAVHTLAISGVSFLGVVLSALFLS